MRSMHSVTAKLKQLSALGIKIAIDDFGTGYSSLSYLKSLPIHVLKVDQSFLEDIRTGAEQETIVSAIAVMARGMNLGLVAEGVEEEVQADYLQQIGCECAQGFLFSRPMGMEHATRYLSARVIAQNRIAG
jgi:EAL domain-containing protein (putative c-di-GMP-specific phosphodiesterase class I)